MPLPPASLPIHSSVKNKDKNGKNNPYTGLDRSLGLQEIGAARIYRQSGHDGCKVASRTHRRA